MYRFFLIGLAVVTLFESVAAGATVDCTANPSLCQCYFQYSPWSACSNQCGAGSQSRTAKCLCNNIETTDLTRCGSAVTTQSCTGTAFYWSTSAWSTCISEFGCGTGSQSRDVSCRCAGALVDETKCLAVVGKKSATTRSCDDVSRCVCSWYYEPWGQCVSTGCTTGTQTRVAKCRNQAGATCLDAACGPKESVSRSCQDKTGCTCDWKYDEFGSCSNKCGAGTRTRAAKCFCGTFYEADQSKCTTPAQLTQPCEDYSTCTCCWVPGEWSTCNAGCGSSGTQDRSVKCQCGGLDVTDESRCAPAPKPDQHRTCQGEPCCAFTYGDYCDCNNDCGTGVQTRGALCKCGDAIKPAWFCGTPVDLIIPCTSTVGCPS